MLIAEAANGIAVSLVVGISIHVGIAVNQAAVPSGSVVEFCRAPVAGVFAEAYGAVEVVVA